MEICLCRNDMRLSLQVFKDLQSLTEVLAILMNINLHNSCLHKEIIRTFTRQRHCVV